MHLFLATFTLDSSFLFASLIWGSVGSGYVIYGKKQQSAGPFVGGVAMVMFSYFIESALIMSILCIGLMIAVYKYMKRVG
jgi:hypothetical protein